MECGSDHEASPNRGNKSAIDVNSRCVWKGKEGSSELGSLILSKDKSNVVVIVPKDKRKAILLEPNLGPST